MGDFYFLFEDDPRFVKRWLRQGAVTPLIAPASLILRGLSLGKKVIPVESLIPEDLTEYHFCDETRAFLNTILEKVCQNGIHEPKVGGVSILEIGASTLALTYLQKEIRHKAISRQLLDALASVDRLVFNSTKNDLATALWLEGARRRIPMVVMRKENRFFKLMKRGLAGVLWTCREFLYALRGVAAMGRRWWRLQADVLFVMTSARQHESAAPVLRELLKREVKNLLVVSKEPIPVLNRVADPRLFYVHWSQLRDLRYWGRLLTRIGRIRRFWTKKIRPTFQGDFETIALHKWFENRCHSSVRALLLAQKVVSKIHPPVIVAMDPSDYEAKCFTEIGKHLGVPSFCIQYGMMGAEDTEWRYFTQDYVGTFDVTSAKTLEEFGIPRERILVSGNPRFDLYQPNEARRKKFRETLKIPPQSTVIGFTSIPTPSEGLGKIESAITAQEYSRVLETVYRIPWECSNSVLVVKTHPDEDISIHNPYRKKVPPDRLRFITNGSAYEILNGSDIVITLYSTSGLEAILLDKDLIFLNLSGREDMVDYASRGAAWAVRREEDLVPAIRSLLSSEPFKVQFSRAREQYRKLKGIPVGKCAKNCADAILAIKDGRIPNAL